MDIKLGFNIDHIATLRNARGEGYPNLIKAANIAIQAGAHQITAHLREDRRHIKDHDIYELKSNINVDLNLEMANTKEMVNFACKIKPNSVCLVPERRQELTTEGGLDVISLYDSLISSIEILKSHNIKVFLFLDAEEKKIYKALNLPIDGIEINTGKYANICTNINNSRTDENISIFHNKLSKEIENILLVANLIKNNNLEAHAGHGLNYFNIRDIVKIKAITEFNIGHFLIAEATFIGLHNSIAKMLELIINER